MKSNLKSQNSKITWSEESKKCGDYNFSTNFLEKYLVRFSPD